MTDKLQALKTYFGHDGFREGQEALCDALLSGRDALGIMPTGAGKSVCYQLPALLLPGVTLVISPLISLMQDQVAALKAAGIPAAYLNSSLTPAQMSLAMRRAGEGAYKLIYVAPERLETPSFRDLCRRMPVSLVAVDEAHCVSQWGQDFRPDYLRIAAFIGSLPARPPVGAFTATATARVREDILSLLGLRDPVRAVTGFDRPNLFWDIIPISRHRVFVLLHMLERLRGQCGIVYCATRKDTEAVCEALRKDGHRALRYHAGLSEDERRENQEAFQYDRCDVIVATNAFGMGIDKPNVRFVIHYNMPKSIEAYYQEAGRAGRDGDPALCALLFSKQDIVTARWLIENGEKNPDLSAEEQTRVYRQDMARLRSMIRYSEARGCCRAALLGYFGEPAAPRCGGCSVCAGTLFPDAQAITQAAKPPKRKTAPKPAPRLVRTGEAPSNLAPADEALFEALRLCRAELARRRGVPAYVICHDRTLREIAAKKPHTLSDLEDVYGLGESKIRSFGPDLLRALSEATGRSPTDG
ncbi:MAG: RecQ family ATP-dependent DNA helicase [Clostridia bacterium]|nr:RecQ family ATP-dependent DNA helicase [Clostridia bacterium]